MILLVVRYLDARVSSVKSKMASSTKRLEVSSADQVGGAQDFVDIWYNTAHYSGSTIVLE